MSKLPRNGDGQRNGVGFLIITLATLLEIFALQLLGRGSVEKKY
jgi:hypothetical protein